MTSGRVADLVATATDPLDRLGGRRLGRSLAQPRTAASPSTPVFDQQAVQSIGAIGLDPQDPKTIWVGTGEPWTRNSTSVGNGVYKSTDGGDSWQHMGLADSERIASVTVDPKDGKTVWVCAARPPVERQRRARRVQDQPTAARPGRRCSTSTRTPAAATSRSTPRTRASPTPACGSSAATRGRFS